MKTLMWVLVLVRTYRIGCWWWRRTTDTKVYSIFRSLSVYDIHCMFISMWRIYISVCASCFAGMKKSICQADKEGSGYTGQHISHVPPLNTGHTLLNIFFNFSARVAHSIEKVQNLTGKSTLNQLKLVKCVMAVCGQLPSWNKLQIYLPTQFSSPGNWRIKTSEKGNNIEECIWVSHSHDPALVQHTANEGIRSL